MVAVLTPVAWLVRLWAWARGQRSEPSGSAAGCRAGTDPRRSRWALSGAKSDHADTAPNEDAR